MGRRIGGNLKSFSEEAELLHNVNKRSLLTQGQGEVVKTGARCLV